MSPTGLAISAPVNRRPGTARRADSIPATVSVVPGLRELMKLTTAARACSATFDGGERSPPRGREELPSAISKRCVALVVRSTRCGEQVRHHQVGGLPCDGRQQIGDGADLRLLVSPGKNASDSDGDGSDRP